MSCPTQVWAVQGPGYTFAFIVTIAFPIMMIVFLGIFLYFKNSSVFLRKRPVDLTVISIIGGFVTWGSSALYDVLGSQNYPCWLYMIMVYICVPFVGVPVLLKMFRYVNEVSAARLLEMRAGSENGVFVQPSMWVSYVSYMRAFFGNRDRQVRLKAIKFTSSRIFTSMWISVAILPYLLVYTIRLLTSTAWREGCYGCEMETPDVGFLLGFYGWGTFTVAIQTKGRIRSRDALRIKREAYLAWIGGGVWITLSILLYLIDPNDAYVNSQFNFRILMLLGAVHVVYVQTVHQVIVAKRLQRKLLVSPNFNREDLFTDVIQDKELSQQLRIFLQGELSGEILWFLDAVDQWKRDFEVKKESRQRAAREIYDKFIVRRAPHEVNLSHDVREAIITRITPGNVNVHVFDEAYAEIRSMLLRDGFTRFLNSMRNDANRSQRNAQVVTMASSVAYSV